jgi:L-threonylcarbamoyladenylate synthase
VTEVTRSVARAAELLRAGEVVAFPTETVYGLGADARDDDAIRKIFAAKGRPSDNPLIVHVASAADVDQAVRLVTPAARLLMQAFFPGPLTVVLPKRPEVSRLATAGLDTVGVRMPSHATALAFLEACGRPVAAPSANISGRPSPTTWEDVLADLDGRIACVLAGDPPDIGLESTVVDCTGDVPVVLRFGGLALDDLRLVVPDVVAGTAGHDGEVPRSPGAKYKHYAPKARVTVVDDPASATPDALAGYIGLDAPRNPESFGATLVCDDVTAYARSLFRFFRFCDDRGLNRVYCQAVPPAGLGLAVMDRIRRAAESG